MSQREQFTVVGKPGPNGGRYDSQLDVLTYSGGESRFYNKDDKLRVYMVSQEGDRGPRRGLSRRKMRVAHTRAFPATCIGLMQVELTSTCLGCAAAAHLAALGCGIAF